MKNKILMEISESLGLKYLEDIGEACHRWGAILINSSLRAFERK